MAPRAHVYRPGLMRMLLSLPSSDRDTFAERLGVEPRVADLYRAILKGDALAGLIQRNPRVRAVLVALREPASLAEHQARLPLPADELGRVLAELSGLGLVVEQMPTGGPPRPARAPFLGVLTTPREVKIGPAAS